MIKKEKLKTRKESVNGLRVGLLEALEFSKGNIQKNVKITVLSKKDFNPKLITSIKKKHSIKDYDIAKTLGVSSSTIKSWEEKKSRPSKTAQRMLYLIDKKPEIMSVFDNSITYK